MEWDPLEDYPRPSREELDRYRAMTNEERLALTMKLSAEAWTRLLALPPEEQTRRFAKLRQEKAESSQAILEGLARAEGVERWKYPDDDIENDIKDEK